MPHILIHKINSKLPFSTGWEQWCNYYQISRSICLPCLFAFTKRHLSPNMSIVNMENDSFAMYTSTVPWVQGVKINKYVYMVIVKVTLTSCKNIPSFWDGGVVYCSDQPWRQHTILVPVHVINTRTKSFSWNGRKQVGMKWPKYTSPCYLIRKWELGGSTLSYPLLLSVLEILRSWHDLAR